MIRNCSQNSKSSLNGLYRNIPAMPVERPFISCLWPAISTPSGAIRSGSASMRDSALPPGVPRQDHPRPPDARPRPDKWDGGGMSGLANRLSKLERVAAATWVDCAGCIAAESKTRFLVVLPREPAPPELSEQFRVRCEVCGQERTGSTIVMRVIGPSMRKSFGEGAAA